MVWLNFFNKKEELCQLRASVKEAVGFLMSLNTANAYAWITDENGQILVFSDKFI